MLYQIILNFLTIWEPIIFNIFPGLFMISFPRKWNRIWCRYHFTSPVVIREYGLIMCYFGICQLCLFQITISEWHRLFLFISILIEWTYAYMMLEEHRDIILLSVMGILSIRFIEMTWWIICL